MEWVETGHFKLGNIKSPEVITLGSSIKGIG